ncbi:LamG domain-containing protein [Patescibacteria group bacterium]|nr:LamG domain-containing protein [Patescibacteria group bacterium]
MYPEEQTPLTGSVDRPSESAVCKIMTERTSFYAHRMLICLRLWRIGGHSCKRALVFLLSKDFGGFSCYIRNAKCALTWIVLASILVNTTSVTQVFAASGDFLPFDVPLKNYELLQEPTLPTASGAVNALEVLETQIVEEIEVIEEESEEDTSIIFDAGLDPASSTKTLSSSGVILESGTGSLEEPSYDDQQEELEPLISTGAITKIPDSGSGTWSGSGSSWDFPETESETGTVVTSTGSITSTGSVITETSSGDLVTQSGSIVFSGSIVSSGSALVESGASIDVDENETESGSIVEDDEDEDLREIEGLSGSLLEEVDHFFGSNIYPTFSIPKHKEIISTQEFMERLEVKVTDSMGEELDMQGNISEDADHYVFMLTPPENFRPGNYHIEALLKAEHGANRKVQSFFRKINTAEEEEVQDVLLYSGDVPLGLIAFNTDRPSFVQWQGANVEMTVSDENGQPLCDASVDATVVHPNATRTILSTEDGSIEMIDDCVLRSIAPLPDYTFQVAFPSQGIYSINVNAQTRFDDANLKQSGSVHLSQKIPVTEDPLMLDVKREFVTRTFADNKETMEITVIPMHTFVGEITDRVPPGFEVLGSNPPAGVSESKITGAKTLTWNRRWEAGIPITLSYSVRTPSASPIFSLFGPLRAKGTIEDSEPEPITLPRFILNSSTGSLEDLDIFVEEKEEKEEKEDVESASGFLLESGSGSDVINETGSLIPHVPTLSGAIIPYPNPPAHRSSKSEGGNPNHSSSGTLFKMPSSVPVKSLIEELVPDDLLEMVPSARNVRAKLLEMEEKKEEEKELKEIKESKEFQEQEVPSTQEQTPVSNEIEELPPAESEDKIEENAVDVVDVIEESENTTDSILEEGLESLRTLPNKINTLLEAYNPRTELLSGYIQIISLNIFDKKIQQMSEAMSGAQQQLAALSPRSWLQLIDDPYKPSTMLVRAESYIAQTLKTYRSRLLDAPKMISVIGRQPKKYIRTPSEIALLDLIALSSPAVTSPPSMGEVARNILDQMFKESALPQVIVETGYSPLSELEIAKLSEPQITQIKRITSLRLLATARQAQISSQKDTSNHLSFTWVISTEKNDDVGASAKSASSALSAVQTKGVVQTFTWIADDNYGLPHPAAVRSMEVAWALSSTPLSSKEEWWLLATAPVNTLPPQIVLTGSGSRLRSSSFGGQAGSDTENIYIANPNTTIDNRTISYEEPRKWQLLSLAVPEGTVSKSQLKSELTLIPEGGNTFSVNSLPTFKLLETAFTETGSLLDEVGNLQTEVAMREIAQVLINQSDIKKEVIKSVIKDKRDTIARNLIEDSVSMSSLAANVSGSGTNRVRKDVLEETVINALENVNVQQVIAEIIEETGELDYILSQVVDEEVTDAIVENIIQEDADLDIASATNSSNKYITDLLNEKVVDIVKKDKGTREAVVKAVDEDNEELETINPSTALRTGPKPETNSLISITLKDSQGNVVESPFHYKPGSVLLVLEPTRQFKPGKYTVEVTVTHPLTGEQQVLTQDFSWGVLAMNTDQDRYLPNDIAQIAFGVLDDAGEIVCDSELELIITPPQNPKKQKTKPNFVDPSTSVIVLSTEDGSIKTTGSCGIKEAGLIDPDYEAFITLSEEGTYQLELTASSSGGTKTITSEILVDSAPPYIVTRKAATRLWPFAPSPVEIEVEFSEDFDGFITETVPSSFQILETQPNYWSKTTDDNGNKHIMWHAIQSAGSTGSFTYIYDAPDVSPEFYLLGPLKFQTDSTMIVSPIPLRELMKNEGQQSSNSKERKNEIAEGKELVEINHDDERSVSDLSARDTANIAEMELDINDVRSTESIAAIVAKDQNAANSVQIAENTLSRGGVQQNVGSSIGERPYTPHQDLSIKQNNELSGAGQAQHQDSSSPEAKRTSPVRTTDYTDYADDADHINKAGDKKSAPSAVSAVQTTGEEQIYYEQRSWQIASDAGVTLKIWDGEGAEDTNWSTGANWSGDSVPGIGDIAYFDGTSDNNSTFDAGFTTTIGGLKLGNAYDGTITLAQPMGISGSVILSGGTLDVSASNYDVTVAEDWKEYGGGTFNARGGTVTLTGTGDSTTSHTLSGSSSFNNITLDNGLVGYWKFDEGSGSTIARDSSQYGNDGTLTNMDPQSDWILNTTPAGNTGTTFFNPYSLDFDGSSNYIEIGNVSDLSFERTDSYTISSWANIFNDSTSLAPIYAKMDGSSPYRGYDLFFDNRDGGKIRAHLINTWSSNAIAVDMLYSTFDPRGSWHHFSVTYDGSSSAMELIFM